MDACIARGGISHVLSQARASLKNPSRPYTPQTSARPLFHGDDYRPGSRPSSSYTVAELKQMAQQTHQKPPPIVPKPAKLPPRPSGLKTRPSSTSSKTTMAGSASSSSLKLVHAPILSDDDSDEDLTADRDNKDLSAASSPAFDPEASLALPSNDELLQSYRVIENCIDDLAGQEDSPSFTSGVDRLRGLVDGFTELSSFFHAGGKLNSDEAATAKMGTKLFDTLASVVLDKWSSNAACVLELTPALLKLYRATSTRSDSEKKNAQIVKLGKNLFVLSKDSTNDGYFCNVSYVEGVLHAISETSSLACAQVDGGDQSMYSLGDPLPFPMKMLIYASGTLKNISNAEDKMVRLLATNRAITILSETMLWCAADAARNKEIAQFLIQTTGILRNLSVSKTYHKQFLEAEIPSRLCGMIPVFLAHQELMVNISRILSKLTLHELPRAQINQRSANMENLMSLIDRRSNSWLSFEDQQQSETRFQDLLFIRVFFVLGNLCAGNDQNRRLVAINFSGSTVLLEVLQFYASRYSDLHNEGNPDETTNKQRANEAEQATEVLIKLVRVIANLAINADVGALLNGNEGLACLLDILEVAQLAGDEELMLNSVSCITNVSYYSTASPSEDNSLKEGSKRSNYCFVETNRVEITRLLSRILMDRNEEAVVEATRAFGNLSRFKNVLEYMSELKVLDCLVVMLDHSNREIVHTVCGVVMNAALDPNTRLALLAVRPIAGDDATDVRRLLVSIVECAAGDDLEMTLVASKALYNLLLSKDSPTDGRQDFASVTRVIGEVLANISGGGIEEPTDEDEDVSDSWSNRQELRLVLPQLLRSVNAITGTS